MGKLFGTDGIRGKANSYPMTPEIAMRVGKAVARRFGGNHPKSRIVIGRDTRISGQMIESALVSGILSMGIDVFLAGIIPTPAVAFLAARDASIVAGIMVSASHNPYYDNGIKIFQGSGLKLTDLDELELESHILSGNDANGNVSIRKIGVALPLVSADEAYIEFLLNSLPKGFSLEGLKIVMDCSNGATCRVAPDVFSRLGAEVDTISNHPDGRNINDGCGSEHPQSLAARVMDNRADIGLAFDGDGDRLIAVDESGCILTGDQVLAICASFYQKHGTLEGNRVVSTVMSNMGLSLALKELGIDHITTRVGDRQVMSGMLKCNAVLGGEDSGHMIFRQHHTTGDGILTALKLIEVMKTESRKLSSLRGVMTVFPQELIGVNVDRKPDLNSLPDVQRVIGEVEQQLDDRGRVLVRYSGTQPVCRVMVEGPSQEETRMCCRKIADQVEKTLGK